MTRQLYDLCGADRTIRFSPFCWRSKLALKHKGLTFEEVDVAFTEKDKLEFSGQKLVPILIDGSKVVSDSWAIADYLDEAYPDNPALMACAQSRAHTLTIKHWVETAVHLPVIKAVLLDLFARLSPADQAYFRESREARFGMTLEQFCQGEAALPDLHKALQPARATLAIQNYLGGDEPSYADMILISALLWGRASSDMILVAADDGAIRQWLDRMGERYSLDLRV